MTPDTRARRRAWPWLLAAVLLAAALIGGWLAWRFLAPVTVTLTAEAKGLPLEIDILPPQVTVRPGEVISVTYRIRNTQILPYSAFGRVELDPPSAADQVQIFLTQCGGLNTYQASQAIDLAVVFRVQAAGLSGARFVTLRHTFEAASPP
jgi:cytochrome c oxidase assembly protein Cox11